MPQPTYDELMRRLRQRAAVRNQAFIEDTLAPMMGGMPPGGVNYTTGSIGETGWATGIHRQPSPFAKLFGARERIIVKASDPQTERSALVHEFVHAASDPANPPSRTRLRVPFEMWGKLMTPDERKALDEEYKSYPGGGTPLGEDFAYRVENVFNALDSTQVLSEAAAIAALKARLKTRRERYIAGRFLFRQDSPFYTHPHKDAILQYLRRDNG